MSILFLNIAIYTSKGNPSCYKEVLNDCRCSGKRSFYWKSHPDCKEIKKFHSCGVHYNISLAARKDGKILGAVNYLDGTVPPETDHIKNVVWLSGLNNFYEKEESLKGTNWKVENEDLVVHFDKEKPSRKNKESMKESIKESNKESMKESNKVKLTKIKGEKNLYIGYVPKGTKSIDIKIPKPLLKPVTKSSSERIHRKIKEGVNFVHKPQLTSSEKDSLGNLEVVIVKRSSNLPETCKLRVAVCIDLSLRNFLYDTPNANNYLDGKINARLAIISAVFNDLKSNFGRFDRNIWIFDVKLILEGMTKTFHLNKKNYRKFPEVLMQSAKELNTSIGLKESSSLGNRDVRGREGVTNNEKGMFDCIKSFRVGQNNGTESTTESGTRSKLMILSLSNFGTEKEKILDLERTASDKGWNVIFVGPESKLQKEQKMVRVLTERNFLQAMDYIYDTVGKKCRSKGFNYQYLQLSTIAVAFMLLGGILCLIFLRRASTRRKLVKTELEGLYNEKMFCMKDKEKNLVIHNPEIMII